MQFDIGYVGGGQLARMSIQAAQRMGLNCLSLDRGEDSPAAQVAASVDAKLDDAEALAELLKVCARVTLENEFVPAERLREACALAEREEDAVLPGIDTLATIQDKLLQREALHRAGVPAPRAVAIGDDGAGAVARIGFPMVLKSRFGGYDGKGTRYAKSADEMEDHRLLWSDGGWMAEEFVPFRRELAVMVLRTPAETVCFPTMETIQRDHVCDLVLPAGEADGSEIAVAAVEAVAGFGLFGVELFEREDGSLQVNEIAPRPHNSGHYSMDWGGLSQFDAHVRAVMGWRVGAAVGQPTIMANLLGQDGAGDFRHACEKTLELFPASRIHWYGKRQARPGRKMGHLNHSAEAGLDQVRAAREAFYRAWIESGASKRP